MEDDTIVKISKDTNVTDKDDWEIIDCEGYFILPGLIDLHTHLIWSGGDDPVRTVEDEGIQLSLLHAVYNGNKNLEAGITTVRDLGSNENTAIALAKAVERGYISGPRIITGGCSIIMTGGHDPFWGVQADGEVEVVRAVRRQISLGAKVIKVSATGGVYGRIEGEEVGTAELTYKELKAICDEAHRFGLRVAAHAISEEGICNCIKAGIDTIEHGHFLTEKAMDQMIEKNIFWVPTLFTYRQIAKGEDVPYYAAQKAKKIVGRHRDTFIKALQKNVPFAAGSDAGSPAGVDHPSLLGELQSMVEYGCKPIVALKAATIYAAQALGMEKYIGTLEVGKKADILAISKSPLDDIKNLSDVILVMKDGEIVKQ